VDRLEQDMQGELQVIRLDVNSPAGRELGARWRAVFTPTFILFDRAGRELWRGARPPTPDAVRAALEKPSSNQQGVAQAGFWMIIVVA